MPKIIYNLENVFSQTGCTNLRELEERGYDVQDYLDRRRQELEHELGFLKKMESEYKDYNDVPFCADDYAPQNDPGNDYDMEPDTSWFSFDPADGENYIGT